MPRVLNTALRNYLYLLLSNATGVRQASFRTLIEPSGNGHLETLEDHPPTRTHPLWVVVYFKLQAWEVNCTWSWRGEFF